MVIFGDDSRELHRVEIEGPKIMINCDNFNATNHNQDSQLNPSYFANEFAKILT